MEAIWFESGGSGLLVQTAVVVCLSFRRWNVADGLKQPMVVEPGDPFEGSQFDQFSTFPSLRYEFSAGRSYAPLGERPGEGAGTIKGIAYFDQNDDGRVNPVSRVCPTSRSS